MLRESQIVINLKELAPEGQDFTFSEKSSLKGVLEDLVGSNPFQVSIRLTPTGNSFSLKGQIQTGLDLQCSRCATDFKNPVSLKLNEIIVVTKGRPSKGDQQSKVNHAHEWESGGPDYIILDSETFDLGEYVHEMIALSEPIQPLCGSSCDIAIERSWLSVGDKADSPEVKSNPFKVLENIKLKS